MFADRADAGRRLGVAAREAFADAAGGGVVVLGIPRGGVVVAAEVAREVGATLDVVIPRKLGAPGNPELGLGAVAGDVVVVDAALIDALGVSAAYLHEEIERQRAEIERRAARYRAGRPPVALAGARAIVVDDGVATGGTAAAALRSARASGAARVVLAVPVAPAAALRRLADECDDVVVLSSPPRFHAVGQWYADFEQVDDERVEELLRGRSVPGGEDA